MLALIDAPSNQLTLFVLLAAHHALVLWPGVAAVHAHCHCYGGKVLETRR
jgi:hypothetical protein